MGLVIWTRAMDDWEFDRLQFGSLTREVLHLPCIELTGLPVKFPKQKPQVFVFTSANAVRYSFKHNALVNLIRSAEVVYAVGPSTQAALVEKDIPAEVPPDVRTAEQLAIWLSRNIAPDTTLALPTAKEPSFDVKEYLARYAITVDVLPVYQTNRSLRLPHGKLPDQATIERFKNNLEGVVCFASPSAVEGFINTLQPQDNRLHKALTAVTMGPSTHKAATGHFDQIVMIHEPSLSALIAAAANIAKG